MKWAAYKERRDRFIGRGWGWCSWLLLCVLVFSVGWPSDIPVARATNYVDLSLGARASTGNTVQLNMDFNQAFSLESYSLTCTYGGSAATFLDANKSDSENELFRWYPGPSSAVTVRVFGTVVTDLGSIDVDISVVAGEGTYAHTNLNDQALTPVGPPAVGVSISGSDNASVGTSYTYDATISPGTPPYSVQFMRSSTDHPADDRVYTVQTGSGTTFHQVMTFPSIDDGYEVSVTVTDSASPSTSATDTMTVNASADKPALHAALVRGANGMPSFALYRSAPGSPPDLNGGLATSGYVVTSPEWVLKGAKWYVLNVSSPFANPLKVYVTYTDSLNLMEWNYVFSFDTSTMDSEGDYDTDVGAPGDGTDVIPTWLDGLVKKIKDMLQKLFEYLFKPTTAQLQTLFGSTAESGTAFSPLSGLSAGGTSWDYTITWQGSQLTLVSFDLAVVPEATWTLCRTIVGALVGGAEIILLISLL